ncbi:MULTISPECIES: hypothetical protein [Clostridium]|uniref:hypothetical protein n=1 Tax=Clostridium TaxID=1485 RepID=UPI001A9C4E2E|nr:MULTISPECIES: hypothetical protein [Clostridium]
MKTKLEISKDINYEGKVGRSISVDRKLDLKVGQEYNFFHEVESWGNQYSEFYIENDNELEYHFSCINAKGHEVDYENEEECEILDAEGCENECEVLIHKDTQKFIITFVSTDEDFEEMGYYEVELEVAE